MANGCPCCCAAHFPAMRMRTAPLIAWWWTSPSKSACRKSLSRKKSATWILLEQSQDIFFDVDTEKRQFRCSPNFLLKFGREATPLFNETGRPTNRHIIHPEDLPCPQRTAAAHPQRQPHCFCSHAHPHCRGALYLVPSAGHTHQQARRTLAPCG